MSQSIQDITNISSVKITDLTANPAPLGLMGFGMTTVLLNIHNAGFYPMNAMILSMGFFYGGLAQVIAGIQEWKKGNTFGATAFTSYGLFWLTLVGLVLLPKSEVYSGLATESFPFAAYLFMWGRLYPFHVHRHPKSNESSSGCFSGPCNPVFPSCSWKLSGSRRCRNTENSWL